MEKRKNGRKEEVKNSIMTERKEKRKETKKVRMRMTEKKKGLKDE